MESIEDDPRFSHVASDPRFKPMPKSKRKVKIDSRFQSLFTSKHFSHRTDIDKRGKPAVNSVKKNKHVMERFYQLSDDSDTDDDESDGIEEEVGDASELNKAREMDKNHLKKAMGKLAPVSKNESSKKEIVSKAEVKKRKHCEEYNTRSESITVPVKKGKVSALKTESNTLASQNGHTVAEYNQSEEDGSDDSEEEASEKDEDENDEESGEDDEDDEEQEELPQYTEEYEMEETNIDHRWNELHTDAVEVSESTHRLAVCNMDWDFVKAQDLFVLFKSFVPEGGRVVSVTIYPSEFGKERMAEEAKLGPREMRKTDGDETEEKDDVKTGGKKKKKGKNVIDQQKVKRNEKEKVAVQQEKLREYQLNRLRYYFAVVDCDSVQTADLIYNECDGREYQLSSVRLDLRFIPEDMTFDDDPHDAFSEEQNIVDYQPNTFNSTALCQAKVEVTWDETEFDRLSQRMRTLQQKELESIVEENKYADIIAPPESDSEDEDERPEWLKTVLGDEGEDEEEMELTEEAKIQLYRKVLMEKLAEEEEEKKKEEGDVDQEVQWQPGLKTSVEKKMKRKEKDSGVVGEYLDKKKTKKKIKKAERLEKKKETKEAEEEDQAFSDDELPEGLDVSDFLGAENDNVLGKSEKKKKKNKRGRRESVDEEMDENERAELELMLMGEDNDKSLAKPEEVKEAKSKSSKKKKKKLAMMKKKAAQETEDFKLDVNDDRFSALYTSHLYHIDPTAPQFKKTKNMERLVDEQIKRKNKSAKKLKCKEREEGVNERDNISEEITDSKAVSKKLVESLKKKMKKSK